MKSIRYILIVLAFLFFGNKVHGVQVAGSKEKVVKELQIYPLPIVDQKFTVETKNAVITNIKVLNILGKQVYEQGKLEQSRVNLEIGTIGKGLYLIQVTTRDKKVFTERILFQ